MHLIMCMKQEVFLNSPDSMATEGQACDDMKKFVRDTDNECGTKCEQISMIDARFWKGKKRSTQQQENVAE